MFVLIDDTVCYYRSIWSTVIEPRSGLAISNVDKNHVCSITCLIEKTKDTSLKSPGSKGQEGHSRRAS
eukprot:163301-Amphidinium_carterae.2